MDQSDVNTKLKHKEWRKIAKKFRRKRLRQAFAKARDEEQEKLQSLLEKDPKYIVWQTEQKALELFKKQEEERIRDEEHKKWLENELEAQKKWKELQEKLKAARELKEKQQQLIKKEWEEQQKKIEEERERKAKIQKEQEERYRILMQKIEDFIKDGGKIPDELKTPKDTNPSKPLCPFFTKIGACRFGDSCSRNHQSPGISKVLLLRNFYTHFGIEKCFQSEYGNDMALEYDDKETYEHFKEFFFDTIAEFKKSGRVVQYKVCCNTEPHLRGNVYVEYERTRDALKAYRQFQGRWYGGKQLNVEFSGVSSWKKAICGMFFKKLCHKGQACNFLHVYKNPGNLFLNADKDLHRVGNLSDHKNETNYNETFEDPFDNDDSRRNWRWSESPEPPSATKKHDDNNKRSETHRRDRTPRERSYRSERSSRRLSSESSRSDRIYYSRSSREKHHNFSERSTYRKSYIRDESKRRRNDSEELFSKDVNKRSRNKYDL